MRAKIGNRLLSDLTPNDKPFEIVDTELTGFVLRIQPSGVMTYYAVYRLPDGRKNRHKIGRADHLKPAQARDKAKIILGEVADGKDPATAKKAAKATNFASYLENTYGPWVETHRKDGKATLARLKSCFSSFNKLKLPDITVWNVDKWRSVRLKAGIKPATVNRDLAALKSALSKAVEWGIITDNPTAKVKPSKVDRSAKVRFLSEDEEELLRNALFEREERIRKERDSANEWRQQRGYTLFPDLRRFQYADHLAPMVTLSINTGIRQGELFSLTWEHVDLKAAMMTVEGGTAKSQQTRHLPLNDEALDVLCNWQEQTGQTAGFVFPGSEGKKIDNVKRSWGKVLKAAGIDRFRWHDMRHHFASRLVMAGVDLNTVRELLGHSDIKMTLRYAHLAPAHKAAAVAKLTKCRPMNNEDNGGEVINLTGH